MASGDRSKTWFPEMVEGLWQSWRGDVDIDELIALAQRLDCLLHDIRTQRGIRPPTIFCPKCGQRGPAAEPRVSVRATILAAGRFGIAAEADVKRLERLWEHHRSRQHLDLYGRPEVTGSRKNATGANGCTVHAPRAAEP